MPKTASKVLDPSNIKPLFDNVLIKPEEEETKTAAGIYLPESASKEKPQVGVVVAVGPGITDKNGKLVPMMVKPKQKVMYKKWGGNEIKVNGVEWTMVEQKDILAVVE